MSEVGNDHISPMWPSDSVDNDNNRTVIASEGNPEKAPSPRISATANITATSILSSSSFESNHSNSRGCNVSFEQFVDEPCEHQQKQPKQQQPPPPPPPKQQQQQQQKQQQQPKIQKVFSFKNKQAAVPDASTLTAECGLELLDVEAQQQQQQGGIARNSSLHSDSDLSDTFETQILPSHYSPKQQQKRNHQQQQHHRQRQLHIRQQQPLQEDHYQQQQQQHPNDDGGEPPALTLEDIEMCQKLEEEYEMALEEREIGYTARFDSVRQSACFSVGFMIMIIFCGTIFFMKQADWSLPDSLLFSIYTITTVGYGNLNIPQTPGFQLYTIFYIFIGIATLTIMVAQVYQCLALEASRAQYSRDKTFLQRRGMQKILNSNSNDPNQPGNNANANNTTPNGKQAGNTTFLEEFQQYTCWDHFLRFIENCKIFFQTNEVGRSLSVIFPFGGLIIAGAAVVGPIEGWTVTESLYYSVVSLTTVGFGDYQPTNPASIWFAVFWLPFSVGFMSLFLGNVATFYIRLSERNINRIERRMRHRIEMAKAKAQKEYYEAKQRAQRGGQKHSKRLKALKEKSLRKWNIRKAKKSLLEQEYDDDNSNSSSSGGSNDLPNIIETNSNKDSALASTAAAAAHMADDYSTNHSDVEEGADCSDRKMRTNDTGTSTSPRRIGRKRNVRRKSRQVFHSVPIAEADNNHNNTHTKLPAENPYDFSYKPERRTSSAFSAYSSGGDSVQTENRRQRIRRISVSVKSRQSATRQLSVDGDSSKNVSIGRTVTGQTMETMKDVIRRVNRSKGNTNEFQNNIGLSGNNNNNRDKGSVFFTAGGTKRILNKKSIRKASFALRVLLQERMAGIIAHDIAGYQNSVEIKENTLSVTIDIMRKVADKWLIPRRARKAFKAVAFEALYFVGEHDLITNGAEALFKLTPIEFHSLFSPLVAAMGDADTIEIWLENTKVLAEVDLNDDDIDDNKYPTTSTSGTTSNNMHADDISVLSNNTNSNTANNNNSYYSKKNQSSPNRNVMQPTVIVHNTTLSKTAAEAAAPKRSATITETTNPSSPTNNRSMNVRSTSSNSTTKSLHDSTEKKNEADSEKRSNNNNNKVINDEGNSANNSNSCDNSLEREESSDHDYCSYDDRNNTASHNDDNDFSSSRNDDNDLSHSSYTGTNTDNANYNAGGDLTSSSSTTVVPTAHAGANGQQQQQQSPTSPKRDGRRAILAKAKSSSQVSASYKSHSFYNQSKSSRRIGMVTPGTIVSKYK